MLQLLVYSVLARRASGRSYLLWAALVALVGLGLTRRHAATALIAVVIAVDARAAGRCCW